MGTPLLTDLLFPALLLLGLFSLHSAFQFLLGAGDE